MSAIRQFLRIEHDFEHDLAKRKQYSGPYIYDADGDLSKRWYVYYSFRDPDTGKLVRQDNIYIGVNEHKNLRERSKALKMLQASVLEVLENGFNPYTYTPALPPERKTARTISQAIDFALTIAKKTYAETSYPDFKSRVKQFQQYLINTGHENILTAELSDLVVIDYLNRVLARSSARNRNNTRTALSSMFTILKDNRLLKTNIVESINIMASRPEKNRAFTPEQEEKILDTISSRYPYLYLFIGFISINLLRPIEICRLHIEDISIKNRQLQVKAKNQALKTKIIPELLLREIPDLSHYNKNDFLFTPTGPGKWEVGEVNRRNYFSALFKKIKDELELGSEYGLYSFRHTYIMKLYRELRKSYSPFEAKSNLMLMTGHSSMKALEAYLREIDAELPEDYSNLLKPKQ